MATVKVLYEGYTSEEAKGHTCSTITLVKDKGLTIIVDPGSLPHQKILIEKLKKENLKVNDVDIVFITHSHLDHYRNIGMFPNAKTLEFYGWFEGDVLTKCNGIINKDIRLIKTPGHSQDSITLLVKTEKGIVAICGDVFWKEDFPKDDPYAVNEEELTRSRKLINEKADFIIPGHGGIYEVKK